MAIINNPILAGFHPDPAICKGHDGAWYLATSTFEWVPGVLIYRSEDLQNWQLLDAPIGAGFIDCTAVPSSGGVWAPCLTYQGGQYWLVYSNVVTWKGSATTEQQFKDVTNYVTWCDDINQGQWATPVNCGGGGFDPSLFIDDDGQKWYLWMWWDWRGKTIRFDEDIKGARANFSGVYIQKFCEEKGLLGQPVRIFTNGVFGSTEGPHIFKKEGYYYLVMAEGGTSWEHSAIIGRSTALFGPYQLHPQTPFITTMDRPDWPLQRVGHASFCPGPTQAGDDLWIMAFLCGRPFTQRGFSPLGRETGIEPIVWRDNWPWLRDGGRLVSTQWQTDYLPDVAPIGHDRFIDFSQYDKLPLPLTTLRIHADQSWCQFDGAGLRLKGQHSPRAQHAQSVVGLHVQDFGFRAATRVLFSPDNYHQFAGLSLRYDDENQYQLLIIRHQQGGEAMLCIANYIRGTLSLPLGKNGPIIDDKKPIELAVDVCEGLVWFSYKQGNEWQTLSPKMNWAPLSDEGVNPSGFTGNMVCLSCHDLLQVDKWAQFDYLSYQAKIKEC